MKEAAKEAVTDMLRLSAEFFEGRLWLFYRNTFCAIDSMLSRAISASGLSLAQARLLFYICECKEISVGELSEQVGMNAGNCSTACKKLEKLGLINRYRGKQDERVVLLSPTGRGEAVYERIQSDARKLHQAVLQDVSEEEREDIINNLDKLERFFKKFRQNHACCEKEMGNDGNK